MNINSCTTLLFFLVFLTSCNSEKDKELINNPFIPDKDILAEIHLCPNQRVASCDESVINSNKSCKFIAITSFLNVRTIDQNKVIVKFPDDTKDFCISESYFEINFTGSAKIIFDAKIETQFQGNIFYEFYKNYDLVLSSNQKDLKSIDNLLTIEETFDKGDIGSLVFRIENVSNSFNYKVASFTGKSDQGRIFILNDD